MLNSPHTSDFLSEASHVMDVDKEGAILTILISLGTYTQAQQCYRQEEGKFLLNIRS